MRMVEPTFDANGYPTEETLRTIEALPFGTREERNAFSHFVIAAWNCEYGTISHGHAGTTLSMSTGGWSGNESIIQALANNFAFWSLAWLLSKRGGRHEFSWNEQPEIG